MRTFTLAGLCLAALLVAGCATHDTSHPSVGSAPLAAGGSVTLTDQIVDAGCAQCMFGLKIDDCRTAIRMNGKVYFAMGACVPDAEEHGKGLCSNILKAKVSGTLVGDKFMATSFTVLP